MGHISSYPMKAPPELRRATSDVKYILQVVPLIVFFSIPLFCAHPTQVTGDPELSSISPVGGQQGTTIQAKFRGQSIDGATSVWSDDPGLTGKVVRIEKANDAVNPKVKPEQPSPLYEVWVELQIHDYASPGMHSLRLVSRRGVSSATAFRVTREAMVQEGIGAHQTVTEAQKVTVPAIINGTLFRPGELNYYSFHAQEGQDLSFQVLLAENFDARVAIYRAGGSWFDSNEPTRLLFDGEQSSDLIPVQIDGTHRFEESGEYFLEVSGLYGMGCPDCVYQVRICPRDDADEFVPARRPIIFDKAGNLLPVISNIRSDWNERGFGRRLDEQWASKLESRGVSPLPQGSSVTATVEPNGATNGAGEVESPVPPDSRRQRSQIQTVLYHVNEPSAAARAQKITIPAIVEGAIGNPGDIDKFPFTVKAGEKLAFEIETPDQQPPEFNPRLSVEDAQDSELFSNLYRRIALFNNNSDRVPYWQNVVAKSLYSFDHDGTYVLQVRDITSRYGGPRYRYRILIRPQIPHVGEVSILGGDRINLKQGDATALNLTTAFEEGFAGSVSFTVEGLPPGVQAMPGAQLDPTQGPSDADVNPEIVSPKYQKSSIMMLADPAAPLTSNVAVVKVMGRAILGGRPGSAFLVASIPLTVVAPPPAKPPEDFVKK